jgi:uncharacterized protein YdiU (UPF0061 family)
VKPLYTFDTTYTTLSDALFSPVTPEETAHAEVLIKNHELLQSLGIDSAAADGATLCGTNNSEPPFAQAYGGHQFGHFTVLGDGRAVILGEQIAPDGSRWDIQLKGSGKTPYSRGGDGKAARTSMLREYLYGEALTHLGIPSSRGLAVVSTHSPVYRARPEAGGILVRVMKSHIRVGTFEYCAAAESRDTLLELADYTMGRLYPGAAKSKAPYLTFFESVMDALITMVVRWYGVGFIHGVMNTDNMSISGESFDYGPCAFMNYYDPRRVYSSIDRQGRYAFGNQKPILKWNLARFGEALAPLVHHDQPRALRSVNTILSRFDERFDAAFYSMMKAKLGIRDETPAAPLIDRFLRWLEKSGADYTTAFVELGAPGTSSDGVFSTAEFHSIRRDSAKVGLYPHIMEKANPRYILRSHLLEEALDDHHRTGSLEKITKLLEVIQNPWKENPDFAAYENPPEREYDRAYTTWCNT